MRIEDKDNKEKLKDVVVHGGYTGNLLNDDHYNYISGYNDIVEVEIDNFKASYFNDDETVLGKIKKEIADEVLEELKEYLCSEIGDMIVSFIDSDETITDEMFDKGER